MFATVRRISLTRWIIIAMLLGTFVGWLFPDVASHLKPLSQIFLRMIKSPGRIESGEVWLDDTALSGLSDDAIRRLRLAGIAMVPQGSMNSLNPVARIQEQIADPLDGGEFIAERFLGESHVSLAAARTRSVRAS